MRWSQTLIPTSKQPPPEARVVSHQLMARAGLIQGSRAGVFRFLPVGFRCLRKLENLFREELESAGYSQTLWPERGSSVEMLAVGLPVTIRYSMPLPSRIYQILQESYEVAKPQAGLLDPCESVVCQAFCYAVEEPEAGGTRSEAEELRLAFERVLRRCGVPWVTAEDHVSVGRGGPTSAHEWAMLLEAGQDLILRSDRGNYSATEDYAASGPRPWTFGGDPAGELEKVHTPGLTSVRDVAKALDMEPAGILKTMVFRTDTKGPALTSGVNPKWAVAVVRGDHSVNLGKLNRALFENFQVWLGSECGEDGEKELRAEWPIGFVGPDAATRKADAVLLVDYDAAAARPWVAGASEPEYHLRNFNWFRECGDRLADPRKTGVADLRDARAGDPSPVGDGGRLVALRCVELGRFIEVQPRPSTVPPHPNLAHEWVVTRAYEIDLFRLLGCAVERSHDEYGIIWPAAIAPFSAVVTALATEGETAAAAAHLYAQLNAAGIDTILDDREARPGVKFADADLIGFPIRVTVGERGLKEGMVEVKVRRGGKVQKVPPDGVVDVVRALLAE